MPYASKAQARAMHAKAERGEISKSTVDEFDKSTNFKHLPEKKKMAKKHVTGTGKHSMEMGTDGGAAGSHDESHKQLGGHRAHIETGHPDELETFHKGKRGTT